MKTLGIVGGLGPESTVDYYNRIISVYRERRPDGSYPSFLINSVDLNKVRTWVTDNELTKLTDYLVAEIEKLAKAGADFGLIAANTPHVVFNEVEQRSPVRLLSIVEATCAAVKKSGVKRPALFGTRFTMQGKFYPDVFSRQGIELVLPDPADQDYIHEKYLGELVLGKFLPETRAALLAIVDRMRNKIDAVILAGTELPLILREPSHNGIPFLDTTKIHVEAAVSEILS